MGRMMLAGRRMKRAKLDKLISRRWCSGAVLTMPYKHCGFPFRSRRFCTVLCCSPLLLVVLQQRTAAEVAELRTTRRNVRTSNSWVPKPARRVPFHQTVLANRASYTKPTRPIQLSNRSKVRVHLYRATRPAGSATACNNAALLEGARRITKGCMSA